MALGCETTAMNWIDGQDVKEMIHSYVTRIRGSCAFMMVGIMSHGCRGGLLGSQGEVVPINDVMRIFQSLLDADVPLVGIEAPIYVSHGLIV